MLDSLFDFSGGSETDKLRNKIQKSSDYKKLSAYAPLKSVFNKYYDKSVLETDDIDVLTSKTEALQYIMPAAEKLQKAILKGNAWELGPKDKPDFTAKDDLLVLMDKLVCSEALDEDLYNITNITDNDLLRIFDEHAITNAWDLFYNVDIDSITKSSDEILQDLSGQGYYYCIDPSELYEAKNSIESEVEGFDIRLFKAKRGRAWLKLAKIGMAGLGISAAFLVTRMGMIPDTMDIGVLGASVGVSVLFCLVG